MDRKALIWAGALVGVVVVTATRFLIGRLTTTPEPAVIAFAGENTAENREWTSKLFDWPGGPLRISMEGEDRAPNPFTGKVEVEPVHVKIMRGDNSSAWDNSPSLLLGLVPVAPWADTMYRDAVIFLRKGMYWLRVTATGPWSVRLEEPAFVDPVRRPVTLSGSGTGIYGPIRLEPGTIQFAYDVAAAPGSSISVELVSRSSGTRLWKNAVDCTLGDTCRALGSAPPQVESREVGFVESGDFFILVNGEGKWQIEFR